MNEFRLETTEPFELSANKFQLSSSEFIPFVERALAIGFPVHSQTIGRWVVRNEWNETDLRYAQKDYRGCSTFHEALIFNQTAFREAAQQICESRARTIFHITPATAQVPHILQDMGFTIEIGKYNDTIFCPVSPSTKLNTASSPNLIVHKKMDEAWLNVYMANKFPDNPEFKDSYRTIFKKIQPESFFVRFGEVGCALGAINDESKIMGIHHVAVHPDKRQQGIGSAMVEKLIECAQISCSIMIVGQTSLDRNKEASALFAPKDPMDRGWGFQRGYQYAYVHALKP